jgi:hypothetical protein
MTPSGQHVAIIGAGAAGLVAAREALAAGMRVTVYEQSQQVAGVWVYDKRTERAPLGARHDEERLHASLYYSLRTNLPRVLMAFRDFPFDDPDDTGNAEQAFPHHSAVRRYLVRFAEHFDLERHIRFGRRVVRIHPPQGPRGAWRVSHRRATDATDASDVHTENFDAVAVCNGHYRRTFVPHIRGLEYFGGRLLHSHNYRSPGILSKQRVVLLGAGSSGVDLALEATTVTKSVVLCAREHLTEFPDHPQIVRVPWPETMDRAGKLWFPEDRSLEADVILFCTGYRYDFPFVPDATWRRPTPDGASTPPPPSTSPESKSDRRDVPPLYRELMWTEDPRLAFVGLPYRVVPFPQFEVQAKYWVAALTRQLQLPTRAARQDWLREHEAQLRASGIADEGCYEHGERQFDYHRELAAECGAAALPDWFPTLNAAVAAARHRNPATYRDLDLGVPTNVA